MKRFYLLPADAYNIATALFTAFVTLDEDFLRVDGIEIYIVITDLGDEVIK